VDITLVRTKQKSFTIEGGKETTSVLLSMAVTARQTGKGMKKAGLDADATPPFGRPGSTELGHALLRGKWGRKQVELVWGDHFMLHLGGREGKEHQTGKFRDHFLSMLESAPSQGDPIVLKVEEVVYVAPRADGVEF